MKTIILLWGSSARGKSQSIKRLAMSLPFCSVIKPWNADDYDSYVIVAASRTYGQTYRNVYDIAKENNYDVIEVTTLFHEGGPEMANGVDLRDAFAENITHLIMKCLA